MTREDEATSGGASAVMLTVGGHRFFCKCGANVLSKFGADEYRCNGCDRRYIGLPLAHPKGAS